jgi:DNA polymerase III subunit gamma/tau
LSCRDVISAAQNSAVQEINGADARKIEDARELIRNAKYAPRGAKYRVYILDEVHQFTPEAFKSLLKILEEPPPSTVFILCTTDPTKVPSEIRSRMLRLNVRPLDPPTCAKMVKHIAKREGTAISGSLALKIATGARGHARDALNLLEAFLNAHGGQTGEDVDLDALLESVLGDASDSLAKAFTFHVVNGSVQEAVTLLNKVYNHQVFCESVVRFAAHVVRAAIGGLRDVNHADLYDEIGKPKLEVASAQLEIWNEAAARVKSFQTNDPYAVMLSATVRACMLR